ncbi:RING-finger-containing ubiquitin ligase [Pyrenophora tritici-repentis]|nr:RING-finger-containing ubiquitin ligase [Pyrenophora tritici-repentis]
MSAQRIGIFTIDFPDPRVIDYNNNQFITLNDSVSFQYRILNNIQTLSTKGVDSDQDPYGILFVPDLQSTACKEQEAQHVPANATRRANLPQDKDYALIAVAPWFSADCTKEYFAAARAHTTKAFFTYQPGESNAKPPVLNDATWDLQDGGSWQSANQFPTYALSSITGNNVMDQLGLYSGNLTDAPYGDQLAKVYDRTDYVRLWATVGTDSSGQLPSLWVFLVIVLAILLVAVSITSLVMHIIQRRRRNDLRERVLNGQVDLEALGVKRLTVSQHILDKLPIHIYTAGAAGEPEKAIDSHAQAPHLGAPSTSVDAETGRKAPPLSRHSSAPTVPTTGMSGSWSQPTCPICMDDFEANETQVRELPCHHVFHPECIDTFLLNHSSLCPMCKQSVLPKGACPVKITNVMVRRERHINRMRARSARNATSQAASQATSVAGTAPVSLPLPSRPAIALGSLSSRIGGAITGRRIFSAPERAQSRPRDIEMGTTPPPEALLEHQSAGMPPAQPPSPNNQACSPTQNRREWARQRALAMLGPRHAPISDAEEEERVPKWRRLVRKVFPIA